MDKKKLFLFLTVIVIPLAIYIKTLLPGVGFWDTGEFQTVPYTIDIAHPTGYPTYIILGRAFLTYFPFGSVAYRMNLFSALCSSLAVGFLFLTLFNISKTCWISFFCSLWFGVSKIVWELSLRADPQTLNLLFTAIFLFLTSEIIIKKNIKYFLWISAVTGLALGNHLISLFLLPAYMLLVIYMWKDKIKNWQKTAFINGFTMVTTSVFVYMLLPVVALIKPPLTFDYNLASIDGFIRHFLGRDFMGYMTDWVKGGFGNTILYYYENLSGYMERPFLIVSFFGFLHLLRVNIRMGLILFAVILGNLGFSLRWQTIMLERYFPTSFFIVMIFFAEGITFFMGIKQIKIRKIVELGVVIVLLFMVWNRVNTNFVKLDQSKNFSGESFAKNKLGDVDPNGVLFSTWVVSTPLWYTTMVEGYRSDVGIVNMHHGGWEKEALKIIDKRPVFFMDNIKLENPGLRLERQGSIYKLLRVK